MQIYISKNNRQLGPFDDAKVLEMMRSGEFSADDTAIRQGESEWQNLGHYFPNSAKNPNNVVVPLIKPLTETPAPRKSRKGLLLGCGGVMLLGLLISAVLGVVIYRNKRPADSTEYLPNSVKTETYGEFKLKTRYPPDGNIWGTEQNFVGIYENELKTFSVIYLATVYSGEESAKKALEEGLDRSCRTGDTRMRFKFVLENGASFSESASCGAPLYIRNGNELISIGGGSSGGASIEFAEGLPFNSGTKMTADK